MRGIARSVEAKYRSLAESICERIWLKRLFDELKFSTKEPMKVFYDNIVANNIAKTLVHHDKTKHVELDCHFIKEKIEEDILDLIHTSTYLQVVDVLMKVFSRVKFEEWTSKLEMINIYSLT